MCLCCVIIEPTTYIFPCVSPPPLPGLNSSRQVLYIADDNEIRSLDPGMPNWRYEQTFQGDANVRIDAMDLHVKTNRVFWTNWHTGRISYHELPGGSAPSGPSGPSSTSHRHRRQSSGGVTTLEVRLGTPTSRARGRRFVFSCGRGFFGLN